MKSSKDPHVNELKKLSKKISQCDTQQKKIDELSKAFTLFSEQTHRLEKAYDGMEKQFKAVSSELEKLNTRLSQKISQFDSVMRYLHNILTNMSQGILFIDQHGIVTTYNPISEKILGIDHLDVLFNKFWEHFKDDFFGFSMKEALLNQRAPPTLFIPITTPNGSKKELEINVSFIANSGKKPIEDENLLDEINLKGIIVLIRDITEMRRLQVLNNRNERLKELGEMAAMVAHEIRNPLGGIKGFAALLQRDLKNQPELKQMAGYIVEGTEHLNRLVTNILNYAHPVMPNFTSTDLVILMQDIRQLVLADSNFNSGIEIIVETKQPSLRTFVDPQFIQSAFLNLIINAIQAMPKGGVIKIVLDSDGQMAIIKVSDTGIGIPPDNLEKIFLPFFTTSPNGSGFGLAEVNKVIQAHGGLIDVQSVVEKGTEFTIKLPIKNGSN